MQELIDRGFVLRMANRAPILFVKKNDRIYVDPKKIEAVVNWPRSTNVTKIHSFLGLARYYRRFVEGFSSIVSSLTKLT